MVNKYVQNIFSLWSSKSNMFPDTYASTYIQTAQEPKNKLKYHNLTLYCTPGYCTQKVSNGRAHNSNTNNNISETYYVLKKPIQFSPYTILYILSISSISEKKGKLISIFFSSRIKKSIVCHKTRCLTVKMR